MSRKCELQEKRRTIRNSEDTDEEVESTKAEVRSQESEPFEHDLELHFSSDNHEAEDDLVNYRDN